MPNRSTWVLCAVFGLAAGVAGAAGGSVEHATGVTDEVGLYNTALTAPEIIAAVGVPEPAASVLVALAASVLLNWRRPADASASAAGPSRRGHGRSL